MDSSTKARKSKQLDLVTCDTNDLAQLLIDLYNIKNAGKVDPEFLKRPFNV